LQNRHTYSISEVVGCQEKHAYKFYKKSVVFTQQHPFK